MRCTTPSLQTLGLLPNVIRRGDTPTTSREFPTTAEEHFYKYKSPLGLPPHGFHSISPRCYESATPRFVDRAETIPSSQRLARRRGSSTARWVRVVSGDG